MIGHERIGGGEEEDGLNSLNRFIDNFIQSYETANSEPSTATTNTTTTATETNNDPSWFVQGPSSSTLFPQNALSPPLPLPSAFGVPPNAHFWAQSSMDQAELHHNLQYAASQATAYPAAASFMASHSPFIQPAVATAHMVSSHSTSSPATTHNSPLCSTVSVYLPRDGESLSPYQCLLRQQLEFFEASHEDASVVQGRNKPVSLYQVGLRCRHCARVDVVQRTAGSTYYPTRLDSIYQSGQNVAKHHFDAKGGCPSIPREIQHIMSELAHEVKGRKGKSSKGGGKVYWAEAAREVGIVETSNGLEFWARQR